MDRWYKNIRNISKQLEEIGFPSAREVATGISETYRDKEQLAEDEIKVAEFIKNFVITDEINTFVMPSAIVSDITNIHNVICFLKEIGFEEELIKTKYSKNNSLFLCKCNVVISQYEYLEKRGLSKEQIGEIFFNVIELGKDAFFDRCRCVEKYFPAEFIYKLGKGFLFYQYYTDPIDCIETLVKELGIEKTKELLGNEEMLLYLWKAEYERDDFSHGMQHREALDIVEKYKKRR